jgi:hypothetical protein
MCVVLYDCQNVYRSAAAAYLVIFELELCSKHNSQKMFDRICWNVMVVLAAQNSADSGEPFLGRAFRLPSLLSWLRPKPVDSPELAVVRAPHFSMPWLARWNDTS